MKKIDSKKYYSLGEIAKNRFIQGVETVAKVSRRVHRHREPRLHADFFGPGIGYKVLGQDIITFNKTHEKTRNHS
jgi:hypothetical protein